MQVKFLSMIKLQKPVVVYLFFVLFLCGCGRPVPEDGVTVPEQTLTVFAAASLTDVMQEIVQEFKKTAGGVVYLNLAGTNTLRLQIEKGAPAQIFISADMFNARILVDKGLVQPESPVPFASNALVVVCPEGRPFPLKRFEELPQAIPRFLSLADPDTVPAGIYAKEAMQNAGVWEDLKDRVVPAVDVRAALAQVEMANTDGGIVYRTDAMHSERAQVVLEVPQRFHKAIFYYKCRVGRHPGALADSFYKFLESETAKAVLIKYGFIPI